MCVCVSSAKEWRHQRTKLRPQVTLDVKEARLWRILIIISVHPLWIAFSRAEIPKLPLRKLYRKINLLHRKVNGSSCTHQISAGKMLHAPLLKKLWFGPQAEKILQSYKSVWFWYKQLVSSCWKTVTKYFSVYECLCVHKASLNLPVKNCFIMCKQTDFYCLSVDARGRYRRQKLPISQTLNVKYKANTNIITL